MSKTVESTVAERKREIAARHAELNSWAKVAAEYPGVKRGTLQRFATNGYEPKAPAIRKALGLPPIVLAPAPVCPKCGVVHVRKTCPPAPKESYDAWKTRNLPALRRLLAWCETPRAERRWG